MTEYVPASLEHERELLGALLVRESSLPLCQEVGLVAEHFYAEPHRALYRAVLRAADDGGRGDELATWAAVESLGLVSEKLSRAYVSELAARVTSFSVRTTAQRIVELAGKRAKLEGAQMIAQGAREPEESLSADLIAEGMALLARDFTIESTPTSGEEVLDELFDYFDRQEEGDVFELPWGGTLNKAVQGGYRRKQLSVLAGWTGFGKSHVLDHMLDSFRGQGYRCAIFATEMSRQERAARWLTARTGVAYEKIIRNRLTREDHSKLAKARADANGRLPFDYYECFGWSADRISEAILSSGVDIAAVDPITEIPGFAKTEVAAETVRRFAELAGRADLHLIAVCHLNRNRLRDPNAIKPRPRALDLKGSGALETLAHAILFLHRDQDDAANVLPTGELYFDKVRNGPPASMRVEQSARTLDFHLYDPSPAQQTIELPRQTKHDQELVA